MPDTIGITLEELSAAYKTLVGLETQNKAKEELTKQLRDTIDNKKKEVQGFSIELEYNKEAVELLGLAASHELKSFVAALENVCNEAIKYTYNDNSNITLSLTSSRNTLCCDILVNTDNIDGIGLGHDGGSLGQMLSVVIRLYFIYLLSKANMCPPIMVLDEPLGGLAIERRQNFGLYLKAMSHKFGIQIIIVTHLAEFIEVADNIINVVKKSNRSIVI